MIKIDEVSSTPTLAYPKPRFLFTDVPSGPIVRCPKLREMSEKSGGKPEVRGSGVDEVEKLTFSKMSRKFD